MGEIQPPESESASPRQKLTDPAIATLAGRHSNILRKSVTIRFDTRLRALEHRFRDIFKCIADSTEAGHPGSRAEEWLLDNRHVVQESMEVVREGLPRGYVRQLPQVRDETGRAVIRVYQLVTWVLADCGQPLDMEQVGRQIADYQDFTVLKTGELWALPALLRLVLLEELADAALQALNSEARSEDGQLDDASGINVASAILGLRQLQTLDWREYIERLSHVEQMLGDDPAGAYSQMDFETRDRYRGAVEKLSRLSGWSETAVAQQANRMCQVEQDGVRRRHVGYFLIDDGRRQLEKKLGARKGWGRILLAAIMRHAGLPYAGFLAVFSLPVLAGLGFYLTTHGTPIWLTGLVMLLASAPVLGQVLVLLNGLITHSLPPLPLPKLDFKKGIPTDNRTAVAMPVLFGSSKEIVEVLDRVEINFLNNSDRNLIFVILSDFSDAAERVCAEDAEMLATLDRRLQALNQRYRNQENGHTPFLLLHRGRCWNDVEGCWMGWERKRGKLVEFNRLLAGKGDTSFETCVGDRAALAGVRYVITLDADTHLPSGAARKLVATLAHPLNHAVLNAEGTRVVAGYGFLQPRLDIDPGSSPDTPFAAIFSGDTTVDLYTNAVSDAYQDLFGEGIYAGKGIYDPQIFDQTLAGSLPPNSLLSHDLLEGGFMRAALVSDIVLYEQYPPNVFTFLRRAHRWIRGDWQLMPWLRRRVPVEGGNNAANPLSWLHQWKIMDNLRRSLMAPSFLALLVIAWSGALSGEVWLWTLLVLALMAAPVWAELLSLVWRAIANPPQLHTQIRAAPGVFRKRILYWLLSLALLPYECAFAVDAALRTLYRMLISRRRLLSWTVAAHVHGELGSGLTASAAWREMWFSPVFAGVAAILLYIFAPSSLIVAAPLLLAWAVAPQLAYATSLTRRQIQPALSKADIRDLHVVARRTWLFFEQFMGPDDHWLPPDNYQEEPRAVLARRTSPTNIGLGLLSVLSAYDFGYIDLQSLLARLNNSFDRMHSLEHYRGHLLNWYETRELQPLKPRYVSTVDSGNLAASLLTLARGLDGLLHTPVSGEVLVSGVLDTLRVLEGVLEQVGANRGKSGMREISGSIGALREVVDKSSAEYRWWHLIDQIYEQHVPALRDRILEFIEADDDHLRPEALGRLRRWLDELQQHIVIARRSQETLEPWQRLLEEAPLIYRGEDTDLKLRTAFQELEQMLLAPCNLESLASRCREALPVLDSLQPEQAIGDSPETREAARNWNGRLRDALILAADVAENCCRELRELSARADRWVNEMDFGFLYNKDRHLFHIGYNVTDASLDPNYYDLLASEARLASYLAIAKGDVPAVHWLHMARPFRRLRGRTVLMSWGATLFEYLMPRLFLDAPDHSMMGRACHAAIAVHRDFTRPLNLPWGISESGYYQLDHHLHYQYQAFGAPGIGFRRDLGERIVVSPYSSMMALPFCADQVVANMRRLRSLRAFGQYGFYEAIDFGRTGKKSPRRARIVRSYMSHHQGMVMLALNNFLHDDIMLRRFQGDRRVAGLLPLLYERPPSSTQALTPWERPQATRGFRAAITLDSWAVPMNGPAPQYNLLSNGHLSVMLGVDGDGGSQWQDITLSPFQPVAAGERLGQWDYIRDLEDGRNFSLCQAPLHSDPENIAVFFGPHRTEYQHRENELFCRLQIGLSSRHDLVARRLLIKNESGRKRRLLLGSFAELLLATAGEGQRHPVFAKLFVESRYLGAEQTMLYRRRPRSSAEKPLYLAHSVFVQPGTNHELRWETDREEFLGRGGSVSQPQAFRVGLGGFTGTTGAVLDPVIGTGLEVAVAPHAQLEVVYLTGVSRSQTELMSVIRSYRSLSRVNWLFVQARMQSEQEIHNLQIAPEQLKWMMALWSAVLVPNARLRAPDELRSRSRAIQSTLWSRGISGDFPILLVRISSPDAVEFVQGIIQAHTFWSGRGQAIDLVLFDAESSGYLQPLRDRLERLINDARGRTLRKLEGSVFMVPGTDMPTEERVRLQAAARVVLDTSAGSVEQQLQKASVMLPSVPPFVPVHPPDTEAEATPLLARPADLQFDNDMGGFSADGREYVIHLLPGQKTPAPWANVLANPDFGCLVSEAGSACTWAGNSGEYRLTPWHNDPVRDPSGELLYLRDEETASVWSPTPEPRPADGAYQVRHGAGYSEYRHHSHGLKQAWRVWVARDAPVKIGRLTLTNCWSRPRRITATYYAEWVLGVSRAVTGPYIEADYDPRDGVILAHNAFAREGGAGTAFLTASKMPHDLTTDRIEFMGRNGGPSAPDALFRIGLSGNVSSGGDSCAAYQVHIDLPPGASEQVYFVLGFGKDRASALELAHRFNVPEYAETAYAQVEQFWDEYLGAVQIETSDPATDLLVNRWLPYQTLSCRLWGRSGYYQSSGAYGFRDQLQDVLVLLWSRPEWTRAHILKAAACQFQAGDVLHWWHEKPLRGVRSRCSDDLLWLPYVTAQYVRSTGDYSVLQESVPYLAGEILERDETERYAEYEVSREWGSIYEHCCRAIEHAATVGPHGLPTIGSGDWNDGFSRISTTGRGESVWLAWFLARVCRDFIPLCEHIGDESLVDYYRELADSMIRCAEEAGWDGAWYRRAYYDDGTPLGSAENDECQIDLIAQAWSVLAAESPTRRSAQAMDSAYRRLVKESDRQILLLAPPFNLTKKDPGYIKGYPPGIRENGGQYTHAAAWSVWAAAKLGDGERAMQLFCMLNPILRAADPAGAQRYRTEPYVLAADIYSVAPHTGRGGWTWYTGAAGWLYRAALEALLGLRLYGSELEINPCLPETWREFRVRLSHGRSCYEIQVELNVAGIDGCRLTLDGEPLSGNRVPLSNGGGRHQVRARIGGAV